METLNRYLKIREAELQSMTRILTCGGTGLPASITLVLFPVLVQSRKATMSPRGMCCLNPI